MDLLYSTIVLLIIAFVWAIIIFPLFRRIIGKQSDKDKKMLFGGFLIFIGLVVIVLTGTVVFEYVESPEFCGTFCHVMEPLYESYINPDNNQIMGTHLNQKISCSNCHNNPGVIGTIEGLLSAVPETIIYVTNTYDINDLHGDLSPEACLKCHEYGNASLPGEINAINDIIVNPHEDETECDECHDLHNKGIGLTQDACPVCHGISFNDFDIRLLYHAERTKLNCDECHNREHPDDAKISFSEYPSLINNDFCSDCHIEINERLDNGVHKSIDCFVCHPEHELLSINFEECNEPCHNPPSNHNSNTTNCITCHDTTKIHSLSGSSIKPDDDEDDEHDEGDVDDEHEESFSNIDCSTCHKLENSAYKSSFTPKSLEIYGDDGCIDCHPNHNTEIYPHIITSPFDNCSTCHTDYYTSTTIHDREEVTYLGFSDITNYFCSNCHEIEFEKFNLGIHSEKECVDCHEDHLIVEVNFDNCNNPSCHIVPSWHNIYMRNCVDSMCHADISSIH